MSIWKHVKRVVGLTAATAAIISAVIGLVIVTLCIAGVEMPFIETRVLTVIIRIMGLLILGTLLNYLISDALKAFKELRRRK